MAALPAGAAPPGLSPRYWSVSPAATASSTHGFISTVAFVTSTPRTVPCGVKPTATSIGPWGVSTRTNSSAPTAADRSEEHTSELQSLAYLVCRLLLEKKKNTY